MCCSTLWHCFASSLSSLPLHGPSDGRWRRLSSGLSRLMFPLHQQNIWESKHKAGEAGWELQPESPAYCRSQAERKGCAEQAGALSPLSPWFWVHGRAVPAAGGVSVQDEALPKRQCGDEIQENQLSTETALQQERGCEQVRAQWRKILVALGAQWPRTAHPRS